MLILGLTSSEKCIKTWLVETSSFNLNRDGEMNTMLINITYLSEGAIKQLNEGNELPYSPIRVIEWWWDGIGTWRG